ncbi:MAG: DUF4192 domain-containing protein [Nocardioides sp.]
MNSSTDPEVPSSESSLTLTARSPEDLLALAPVVLGFFPAESVVMLTFGAADAFHARVDLPDEVAEVGEVVDLLVHPARRHGVERVVLLIYSSDRVLAQALWQGLDDEFAAAGIGVIEALRVEERRWYGLAGVDPHREGNGVPFDISTHPFLVRAVVAGRVTHDSRTALAATLSPDDAAVKRMTRLILAQPHPTDLLGEGTWVEQTIRSDLIGGRVPSDATLARVLLALDDVRLRDAAWSAVSRDHSRAAVAWWTHALTRCPLAWSAAPAALLAWSAWLNGNGALAWCALDRCHAARPGYGLAVIVTELLDQACPPSLWDGALDWRSALGEAPRAG